jgi:hypothetical protein
MRDDKPIHENYKPIIDWYYSDAEMDDHLKISSLDDEDDVADKISERQQYEADKPFLELTTVAECLHEMIEWNRII